MEVKRKILDLISCERPYRLVFYKILRFCEIPRLASEVQREVLSFPEMKTAIHSPNILLGWLKEAGIEEAGVLEWVDKKWRTTEAAKGV